MSIHVKLSDLYAKFDLPAMSNLLYINKMHAVDKTLKSLKLYSSPLLVTQRANWYAKLKNASMRMC